jgi:lipopolysaccharide export system ATP-binding protein
MPILDVTGLCKTYKGRKVVDGVSFFVEQGEIVGLLGPNGAGKTTSFRMTCGMVEPDAGTVLLNEIDVTGWPMYRRAREGGMGYLAQDRSDFRKLTVEANILGMLELLGYNAADRKARCDDLLQQFDITHIRKSIAGNVSGGERRRMEIARCLVSNPEIILLDEPFAGVDPVTVQSIQAIIRRLRDRGIAILITDHAAREILQLADRCYVIDKGNVLCSGPPAEVQIHPEVRRRYLGDIDAGVVAAVGAAEVPRVGPPAPHIASGGTGSEQLPRERRKPFANW